LIFLQELNPALHYNLRRRTPASEDFHYDRGYGNDLWKSNFLNFVPSRLCGKKLSSSKNLRPEVYGMLRKNYQISFKKDLLKRKVFLSLHPAEGICSYKLLVISEKKIKLKFILQNACRKEKNSYFCTRFENESGD
jgi:hypothetical protein